jgi:hypothetical protein
MNSSCRRSLGSKPLHIFCVCCKAGSVQLMWRYKGSGHVGVDVEWNRSRLPACTDKAGRSAWFAGNRGSNHAERRLQVKPLRDNQDPGQAVHGENAMTRGALNDPAAICRGPAVGAAPESWLCYTS